MHLNGQFTSCREINSCELYFCTVLLIECVLGWVWSGGLTERYRTRSHVIGGAIYSINRCSRHLRWLSVVVLWSLLGSDTAQPSQLVVHDHQKSYQVDWPTDDHLLNVEDRAELWMSWEGKCAIRNRWNNVPDIRRYGLAESHNGYTEEVHCAEGRDGIVIRYTYLYNFRLNFHISVMNHSSFGEFDRNRILLWRRQ